MIDHFSMSHISIYHSDRSGNMARHLPRSIEWIIHTAISTLGLHPALAKWKQVNPLVCWQILPVYDVHGSLHRLCYMSMTRTMDLMSLNCPLLLIAPFLYEVELQILTQALMMRVIFYLLTTKRFHNSNLTIYHSNAYLWHMSQNQIKMYNTE